MLIFEIHSWTLPKVIQNSYFQVISNVVAAAMVDRFGRKKLLMTSCATTSVSIASLGIYFYFNDSGLGTVVRDMGWLTLNWMFHHAA